MEKEVVIKNKSGLHARPAALLVKFTKKYAQKLTIIKGERTVDATSLLGVLSLVSPREPLCAYTSKVRMRSRSLENG